MCEAVRAGIQADNDETIRHSYDSALAQRFSDITPTELQRINQTMLLYQLEDILAKKQYEQSLLLAQTIQRTTGQDFSGLLVMRLKRATMRFIRQQDLKNLSVQVEDRGDTNYALVSWQWPASELIQVALLVWHFEAWPSHPSQITNWHDFEGYYLWVRRKDNSLYSREIFPVGRGTHLYIRGYAALLDTWEQDRIWRYSNGDEPTASAEATSPQIIWRNSSPIGDRREHSPQSKFKITGENIRQSGD